MALDPGIHLGSPPNLRSRLHFGKLDSWGTRHTEARGTLRPGGEESLRSGCVGKVSFLLSFHRWKQ